jgi:hypothetical protein
MKCIVLKAFLFILPMVGWASTSNVESHIHEFEKTPSMNYNQLWKTVDSLHQNGLYREASAKVDLIYILAKENKETEQIIKSLLYTVNYSNELDENGNILGIKRLEKELLSIGFPENAIIHSILAELYTKYLQRESWSLMDRKEVEGERPDDLKLWSIRHFEDVISEHYFKSVSFSDAKNFELKKIDGLFMNPAKETYFLKTLYDFLVFRATQYFTTQESRLIKPDDVFYLQNTAALSSLESFINIDFSGTDASSFVKKALLLFQEILTFHLLDKDPTILIDFDRQRLLFVHRNLIYAEKDVLLRKELEHLISKFPVQATTAETYYLLANEKYKQKLLNESVALCEQAVEKYPKTFGAFKCNELLQIIRVKNLSLTVEDNGLPNQPILLKVTFQNIQSFKGGVVPVSFSTFQQSKLLYIEEDIQLFLKNKRPEKEALIVLPKATDYQQHVTEISLDGLPVGHYLYVFKSDETKYSFLSFQISNIGYFVNNEGFEKVAFQFFDKKSTEPKGGTSVLAIPVRTGYFSPNAPVITFKETWKECDDQGFLSYSLPQGAFNFKIANGEDTLLTEENFYIGERYREELTTVLKSNIFSDRKIYRPGQTIFWKAILMERNGIEKPKVSANREVTISFFDPNGSLLVQNTLLSNEMGSLNGRFDIPLNLVKGNYTLVSSHGGNRESIQVEEYKRLQFEIKFEKAPVGILGDSLEVKGNAAFFNGILIENAIVKWEIYRKSFPDNWRLMRRFYTRDAGSFLASGEGITNENGAFSIPFFAQADISIGQDKRPAFQFEVKVTVTSPSGEIQQKTLAFNIGYSKDKLDVQIPENWDKQKGTLDWSLFLSDWNGDKISSDVHISVVKLKEPRQHFVQRKWPFPDLPSMTRDDYVRLFPYTPGFNEDNLDSLEVLRTIYEDNLLVNGEKILEIPMTKLEPGYYAVKIKWKDGSTNVNTKMDQKLFYLFDSELVRIATPKWLDIHLAKDVYNLTDTLDFKIAAANEIKKVLVSFTLGEKIYKEWVNVEEVNRLKIPIAEEQAGLGKLEIMAYFQNEPIFIYKVIKVVIPEEKLKVTYQRTKEIVSPGEKVHWELNISSEKGENLPVEAVATLFDASLESFIPHEWFFNGFEKSNYLPSYWVVPQPVLRDIYVYFQPKKSRIKTINKYYPTLNNFAFFQENIYLRGLNKRQMAMQPMAMQTFSESAVPNERKLENDNMNPSEEMMETFNSENGPMVRNDFSETLFFMPELKSDSLGNIQLSFTMNDALTRWKFILLAHRSDIAFGYTEKYIVSTLPVMLQTNAPRFLREGDEIKYAVTLTNTTNEDISGKVFFKAFHGETGQDWTTKLGFNNEFISVTVPAGKTVPVFLPFKIPAKVGLNSLNLLIKFASGDFGDAIKEWIPILPSQILVTEAKPFLLRKSEKIDIGWPNKNEGNQLGNENFELQITTHPVWIALKSLPYLMENPYDGNEQLFNKLYANVLGTHLLSQYPTISNVLDEWKNSGSLAAELDKNESLKSALLKETPWVDEAKNEQEQRLKIAELLDVSKMTKQVNALSKLLADRQLSNGSWSWFPGGNGHWYITQYILGGWGKLKKLGLLDPNNPQRFIDNANQFCDDQMLNYYRDVIKTKADEVVLSDIIIHYLYTQSFFKDRVVNSQVKEALAYFDALAKKKWLTMSLLQQGQLALFWYRNGEMDMAKKVINSLNDRAIKSKDLGMYWKMKNGFRWYENQVEIQALLIEAFSETGFMNQHLAELKLALLLNKQTNSWSTTKETADAVYALLGGGNEKLAVGEPYPVSISFDPKLNKEMTESIDLAMKSSEAATGFFQKNWKKGELSNDIKSVKIENNLSDVVWGAAFWQYYKEINQIEEYNSSFLSVSRALYVKKVGFSGEVLSLVDTKNTVKIGDKLVVRLTVKADRDMEFIHLNDKRAAGFEPESVLSGYVFKEGLYYFESSSDVGTDFFIDFLPKGTFIIDYPVKVNAEGAFLLGTTTIQCMYAPEFGSHTKGDKIYIVK